MKNLFINNSADLIDIQRASFFRFLTFGIKEEFNQIFNPFDGKIRLSELLSTYFPVSFNPSALIVKIPNFPITHCTQIQRSHFIQLYFKSSYTLKTEQDVKALFNLDILFGEIPLLTEDGTFIIDGCERIIISQIVRAPGIYFQKELLGTKVCSHTATLISDQGFWTKFVICTRNTKTSSSTTITPQGDTHTNSFDHLFIESADFQINPFLNFGENVSLENLSLFLLLNYLGVTFKDMLHTLKRPSHFANFNFAEDLTQLINLYFYNKNPTTQEFLYTAQNVPYKQDEQDAQFAQNEQFIKEDPFTQNELLEQDSLFESEDQFEQDKLDPDAHNYSIHSLNIKNNQDWIEFLQMCTEIYTENFVLLDNIFDNWFSLGIAGRNSINAKLNIGLPTYITHLTSLDFIRIIDELIELKYYSRPSDDIDALQNKQIRGVGELFQKILQQGIFALNQTLSERKTFKTILEINAEAKLDELEFSAELPIIEKELEDLLKKPIRIDTDSKDFIEAKTIWLELAEDPTLLRSVLTEVRKTHPQMFVDFKKNAHACRAETLKALEEKRNSLRINLALAQNNSHAGKTESVPFNMYLNLIFDPIVAYDTYSTFFDEPHAESFHLDSPIDPRPIAILMKDFFKKSELSQFIDQVNPLAEITHKRRISFFGPNGLSRDSVSTNIRDVHPSQYGRLCPVETPEGANAGLMASLATCARLNDSGSLEAPYFFVENKQIFTHKEIIYLDAQEESKTCVAFFSTSLNNKNEIISHLVPAKNNNTIGLRTAESIQWLTMSPLQVVSLASALIPFLEHDDANRALMGSNMQRQAVPILYPQKPIVGTGLEAIIPLDSDLVVKSYCEGFVQYSSALFVIIKDLKNQFIKYFLKKHSRLNQDTHISQKPIVWRGENVFSGQIIADGPSTIDGELCLGQNLTLAYIPWEGYNYEDAIVINERLVIDHCFTSVNIEEYTISFLDSEEYLDSERFDASTIEYARAYANDSTLLAKKRELYTSEESKTQFFEYALSIPDICSSKITGKNLDAQGIIKVGSYVSGGDILVSKFRLSREKLALNAELLKLLRIELDALAEIHTEDQLPFSMPISTTSQDELIQKIKDKIYENTFTRTPVDISDIRALTKPIVVLEENLSEISPVNSTEVSTRKKEKKNTREPTHSSIINNTQNSTSDPTLDIPHYDKSNFPSLENITLGRKKIFTQNTIAAEEPSDMFTETSAKWEASRKETSFRVPKEEKGRVLSVKYNFKKIEGENPTSICMHTILISVAQIKKLQVGDKLSGRHGNKGVIARILSKQDMPYLADGTPIDILLNPLGIPSRMNLGQIFESILGFVGAKAGRRFQVTPFDETYGKEASRILINQKLKEISTKLPLSWLFHSTSPGKFFVKDGRTGEYFDNPILIGKSYILKLIHLVEDKIQGRSVGPYTLVTQQPSVGKSSKGGQRFGEMEVWALEAYGCSNTLQELLTVKSDDIDSREDMYKSLLVSMPKPGSSVNEVFAGLIRELHGLGLDFSARKFENSFSSLANSVDASKDVFDYLEYRLKLRRLMMHSQQK